MIRFASNVLVWVVLVLFVCHGGGGARAQGTDVELAPDEVREGQSLTLRAEVTGGSEPLTYQWYKDGVLLSPDIGPVLAFAAIRPEDAGVYFVTVRNDYGMVISPPEVVRVRARPRSRLSNVSLLLAANASVAAEFSLGGAGVSGVTPMLLRAAGPALTQFGVAGAFPNPTLRLTSAAKPVAANDDWDETEAMITAMTTLGAFPFAAASRDSALQVSLGSGRYVAEVAEAGSRSGVVAVELYDGRAAGAEFLPRVINISARAVVGGPGGRLTAGFTIEGAAPLTLLLRASGPALAGPGSLVEPLLDPRLVLYRGSTEVAVNDNWSDTGAAEVRAAAAAVGVAAWKDNSADAALLVTLGPGSYSVQVSGPDGASGVALLELHEVP